jgi:hypothetical protein
MILRFLFWGLAELIFEVLSFIFWRVWSLCWPLISIWLWLKVSGYFTGYHKLIFYR